MGYHLKIQVQNKKKAIIWTLATMLKYPCSGFFSNYIQYFNDIPDTPCSWFEHQRIQKKNYIVHQFHGISPQNTSTK